MPDNNTNDFGVKYHSLGAKTLHGVEKEKIEPYLDSMRQGLTDDTVKNIAVIGKYGAGKTTVINTFLDECDAENIRPLRLSLATFSRSEEDKSEWVAVERSLVQQMLYGPDNKSLPRSKYRKIEPVSKKLCIFDFISVITFIVCTVLLSNLWGISNKAISVTAHGKLATFLALGIATLYVVYRIMGSFINTFSLSKIGIGKTELAIDGSKSAFNKYLDEILYFFIQQQYNVVVLEDVDRFNSIRIFEHLRELNQVLNNSEYLRKSYHLKGNGPAIRFIYAVKEDLFSNISLQDESVNPDADKPGNVNAKYPGEKNVAEATTKFFDWIVPIVPLVSISNSPDFLLRLFPAAETEFRYFLRSIAIYFDDVRVLETATNDFRLYSMLHSGLADLNPEKMFTVLLFKNGFPKQYQLFRSRLGPLSSILYGDTYRMKVSQALLDKKHQLENDLEKVRCLNNSLLLSEQKSRLIELGVNVDHRIRVQSGQYTSEHIIRFLTFDELRQIFNESIKNKNNLEITPASGYASSKTIQFEQFWVDNENFSAITYFENFGEGNQPPSYASSIRKIDDQLRNLTHGVLQEVIQTDELDILSTMLSQADSASSFLRFSLSEGYIDENIEDYLTIYTGERISPNDRYLIRQIRSGQRLPFETRIDSISKFTADLNEHDLKKPGILLRGIIEYGVRSQEQNAQEKVNLAYSGAIEALVRSSAEAFTEMFEALVNDITDPYRSKLLKDISTGLHHDWTKYQGSSTNIFGLDLLTVISVDDMSGVIATLKGLVDFIDTDDINILQNKEALGKQRVDKIYGSDLIHVTRLDGIPSSDFMDYLIHSGSIRLTPHTMESIILSYAQPPTQIPSYRLVQKLAIDLLTNFIDSNINCFVQIELDTPDSISEEDGHSFVQLLQNELLEEPLKQQLITAYSKNDIELETIPTEYQLQVVRANIYRHDWMNLQFAFTNMEPESIRDILSETNYFGDLSAQFSDEYSDLLVELVDNYQIQFNRFNRNLITTRNDYFGANQSDEVLREMIELNIVQISPELIERVTNQESLLRLTVNRVLPDTESWSEVDQQLFAKLSLEKLLDLIFNSNDRYLSFQCIAVKQVVNKHLFDDSLSDDDRQRLISVILEMPTVDVDAVRKVFSGFLNFDNQMDALYKLTQSDKIENAELVELFSETDCYALKNLVRPDGKPGGYVKFKNEKNIKELLLAFKERGLIGKSKTLKNGGIQVFRRKRSW